MSALLLVGFAFISLFLLIFLVTYNGLIQQRQEIRLAWARMDQLLRVRYQLVEELKKIPQVSGKMSAVIAARNRAAVAVHSQQLAVAESELATALVELIAAGDGESELRQDPRWVWVCDAIAENRKHVEQARNRYNNRVHALNASIVGFPHHMTASMIGLGLQPTFDA